MCFNPVGHPEIFKARLKDLKAKREKLVNEIKAKLQVQ